MRTFTLLILLFSFVLLSCKKDKLEGDKAVLIGKWEWISSYHSYGWCSYDGQGSIEYVSPLSISSTYSIKFSEKGNISFLKDEKIQDEKRIIFDKFKMNVSGGYSFRIFLDGDKTDQLNGEIWNDSILTFDYPFNSDNSPCETNDNYFKRE